MSLGASGALGNALVFFDWKGLDVVREYVIPANPKTDAQNTHRAILTAAVAAIHATEAHAAKPLLPIDKAAYALLGSCEPTPRTWFNQIVGDWIVAVRNAEKRQIHVQGTFSDPAPGQITITTYNHQEASQAGFFFCGTSKTALTKKVAANGVANVHTGVFTGLTSRTKYYFQFRPTKVTDDRYVQRSGIYYHVCT